MTTPMPTTFKIDFVSDIVCPWCAITLHALELAAERLRNEVRLDWHFQPFELNPHMGWQGQNLQEHLHEKYGATPEQFHQTHAEIAQRGAAVGFTFDNERRQRIYNTLNAHRLLHWAAEQGQAGQQKALAHALFAAYFSKGQNISAPDVLLALVQHVGLDAQQAHAVLQSDQYTDAVRARQTFYRQLGLYSVPMVIIDEEHPIQGSNTVDFFEQVLRQALRVSVAMQNKPTPAK